MQDNQIVPTYNDTSKNVTAVWRALKTYLEQEQNRVYEEILNYPPPIPACDVQFNHLIEKRAQLTQALSQLRNAIDNQANTHNGQLLKQFIEKCAYLNETSKPYFIKAAQQTDKG